MNPADITPADVYAAVTKLAAENSQLLASNEQLTRTNEYLIWVISVLTVATVVLTVAIIGQVVAKWIFYRRISTLLTISEQHAQVNESQKDRMFTAMSSVKAEAKQAAVAAAIVAAQSAEEVKQAVNEVPTKVVEKIKETGDGSLPGGELPTVAPSGSHKKPTTGEAPR